MERNTIINSLKNIFIAKMFLFFLLFTVSSTFGQLAQRGNLSVGTNAFFFVGSNAITTPFIFGLSPATTTTFRPSSLPSSTYGKIIFDDGVNLLGFGTSHFVDGYVRTFSTSTFTFPIGVGTTYRPAELTAITNNALGIDAAYWTNDATSEFGSTTSFPVTSVSTKEFWEINSPSAQAFIQLDWNATSDIAALTSDVSFVSIIGWTGSEWEEIPSTMLAGASLAAGTIKSNVPVNLVNYQAITFGVVSIKGALAQKGLLYVDTNTVFYVGPNTLTKTFVFGASPATTSTFRTTPFLGSTYGKITFAEGVGLVSEAVAGLSDHFVDGYVSTLSSTSYTFPIGNNGNYRPATVSTITNNIAGIDAAYTESDPITGIGGPVYTAPITSISNKEFWEINSTSASAVIELNWNPASDFVNLISNLSYLSIVGWDGGKWVQIPSTIQSGNFSSGIIRTNAAVLLSTYKAYTFGLAVPLNACTDLVAAGGFKRWTGTSWSAPGTPPALTDDVEIQAPYDANIYGGFACNTLDLRADITLGPNNSIEVVRGVNVIVPGSKIIMASSSSVVQRDGSLPGPPISLTLKTRTLRRDDYTYFGTPITGDFFGQLANAYSSTMPTVKNALNGMYKWTPGTSAGWQNLTTIETGKGFIAKITNKAPFYYTTPTPSPSNLDFVNVPINGIANNGDVTVPVTKSGDVDQDHDGNYNLLANPYPSAIYAELFLEENTDIDGVVYIWNSTQQTGTAVSYEQADYMAYTKLGTIATSTYFASIPFNGDIASGQGFMVKTTNPLGGDVTFTNCMRLVPTTSNTSFFKTSGTQKSVAKSKTQIDRFKLTLTNNNGIYSQILIGYLAGCTNKYDRMYDASRNSVSTAQLFSLLDDGQKLAINGRPSFNDSDEVPLGITKTGMALENYTISISEKEGIFNTNDVKVYLYDKILGVYHDFENGDYNFSTDVENTADRFSVVYKDANSLSTNSFENNDFVTYIKNGVLYINSKNEMSKVEIYDLTGRTIDSFKVNGGQSVNRKFNNAESIYIIKVKFVDGMVAEQKLINKN